MELPPCHSNAICSSHPQSALSLLQMLHIPTMESGPKLASRILEKLTDIQVDVFLLAGVGDQLGDGSEVKSITVLEEDLSSFSRTHKWAHSPSSKKSDALFCMPEALRVYGAHMHMQQKHSDT